MIAFPVDKAAPVTQVSLLFSTINPAMSDLRPTPISRD